MIKHLITFLLFIVAISGHGFALRGPLEPWMTPRIGYDLPGDNGGPMALGIEYRWNLPVLTYGFDQSFINHFGEPGVQAVEEAIAILNALPPASEMNLDSFPTSTRFRNFELQVTGVYDLKSYALSLLVRELGLTQPERFTWSLRSREVVSTPDGALTNYVVLQRQYDPHTLQPTNTVNGVAYIYQIYEFPNPDVADAIEFPTDPLNFGFDSVAGLELNAGEFYTGLTRDDAGGLRYLYNPTNINIEPLVSGVTAALGNSAPVIDVAARPGVNKITFTRMDWDTNRGAFRATTSRFTDTYISNGVPTSQSLRRVLTRPDITFRARDFPLTYYYVTNYDAYVASTPFFESSSVSTWSNNAAMNNNPGRAGPGTIPPGRVFDFTTISRYHQLEGPYVSVGGRWGSFGAGTNAPVFYGTNDAVTSATIDTRITNGAFVWELLGIHEAIYRIDTTTNLTDWTRLTTLTNVGGHFSVTNSATGPRQFYRAVRTEAASQDAY